MEPDSHNGAPPAPAGDASQPAQTPSTLSSQEQEMLNQLPDFLVNKVGSDDVLKAAGLAPLAQEDAPPQAPAAPAVPPAAEAAPAAPAPAPAPAPETPAAPDPVQQWFEQQAAVNAATAKALSDLATKLNPPPPPPKPKSVDEMTDEEALAYVIQAQVAEALRPFHEQQAQAKADAKAAADAAAREADFRTRAQGFVAAAGAAVGDVVGAERLAQLTPEQKLAVEDEILSTQAANAELKDANGRMVGMTAAQAAQVVKARWAVMAALFGAPPAAQGGRDTMQRARVGAAPGVPAPGAAQALPLTARDGTAMQVPDRAAILKTYGGSTDKILDGVFSGFAKVPKS